MSNPIPDPDSGPENPDAIMSRAQSEISIPNSLVEEQSQQEILFQLLDRIRRLEDEAENRTGAVSQNTFNKMSDAHREFLEEKYRGSCDDHIRRTQAHPTGHLAVSMAKGLVPGTIDLPVVLDAADAVQNDIDSSRVTVQQIQDIFDNRFTELALGASKREITMSPFPKSFAPKATFVGSDRREQIKRIFSQIPLDKRFSGMPPSNDDEFKKKNGEIVNILTDFTNKQEDTMLSYPEFLIEFKQAFTGKALELIRRLILQKTSIMAIYKALEESFYYAETPEEAQRKLEDLTPHNHGYSQLVSLIFEVSRLANIASYVYKDEVARFHIKEQSIVQTLLKTIPNEQRHFMNAEYAKNNNLSGKQMTSGEFESMLRLHSDAINRSMKRSNGSRSQKERKVHAVDAPFRVPFKDSKKEKLPANSSKPSRPLPSPNYSDNSSSGKRGNGDRVGKGNSGDEKTKGRRTRGTGKTSEPRRDKVHAPIKSKLDHCRLCNFVTHLTESCPYFLEEHRLPLPNPCSKCTMGYHDPNYCPFVPKNCRVTKSGSTPKN